MLYQAYQLQSDLMSPLRLMAQHLGSSLWLQKTERSALRKVAAACDVFARLRLTHTRPAYGIETITEGDREVAIVEESVLTLPFGSLLRFRKVDSHVPAQPPVLLVAPLSGHFSTLLRETTRTLLQDHDVYITDWHNARDVALRHGGFGLDDYIDYLMRFIQAIGPGCHVVAVCQPCVAALAATALLAEDDDAAQPRSLTLMAGPVDCRVNPTEVNRLAISKPIDWFEKHLITTVPLPQQGSYSGGIWSRLSAISPSQPVAAIIAAARVSLSGASPLSSRQPRLNSGSPEVSMYSVSSSVVRWA